MVTWTQGVIPIFNVDCYRGTSHVHAGNMPVTDVPREVLAKACEITKETYAFCRKVGGGALVLTLAVALYPDSPGYGWADCLGDRCEAVIELFEAYEFPGSYTAAANLITNDMAMSMGPGLYGTGPATRRLCQENCRCAPCHCAAARPPTTLIIRSQAK